jgi:hypothetical protein
MARVETIILTSDLDGSPADTTVTIGLGREVKDVDLTAAQEAKLRKLLAPYLTAGRRANGKNNGKSNGKASATRTARTTDAAGNAAIRAWARSNGFPELADRGRIPAPVLEAYAAAH